MIFTERTITIRNDSASINTPVILYRGDKNVEVRFTLVESPYKYSNRDSVNIIESTDAAYAQLIIKTPNDRDPIFGDITAVGQSNIIFVIEYGMIDEIGEVGEYDFQIRLFDSDQTSMVTLPEVVSGFIIKEPIAKENATNNITNSAIVGSAVVTSDVSIPTFVGGSYNKTAWHNGTVISRQKLDKIEDGIYETYELSKDNSSQIKEKANTSTTDNLQTQINNLVLGAVGDGNNAEVIQARGNYSTLNDRHEATELELEKIKKSKISLEDIKGVKNIQLFDPNQQTSENIIDNTYINSIHTPITNNNNKIGFLSSKIYLIPGNTYCVKREKNLYNGFFAAAYNDNDEWIKNLQDTGTDDIVFEMPDNAAYIRLAFKYGNDEYSWKKDWFMLVPGNHSPNTIIPYGGEIDWLNIEDKKIYLEDIKGVKNIQLFDPNQQTSENIIDNTWAINGIIYENSNYYLSSKIYLKPNKIYSLDKGQGTDTVYFGLCYDKDDNIIEWIKSPNKTDEYMLYTMPSRGDYIRLCMNRNKDLSNFMITPNSKSDEYIPYGGKIDWLNINKDSDDIDILLPKKIYGVVGQEINIYFDNIIYTSNTNKNFEIKVVCNIGQQQNERWTCIPSTSGIYDLQIKITKNGYITIKKADTKIIVCDDKDTNIKCCFIGDSITDGGVYTKELLNICNGIELLGTRTGIDGNTSNKHEGRSGWTTATYVKKQEVDNIVNPFYNNGFNFNYYMNTNNYTSVDWVFITLGTNDIFAFLTDVPAPTPNYSYWDTMIDNIKAYDNNIKIGVSIVIPSSSDQDGFGKVYGNRISNRQYKKNYWDYIKGLIEKFENDDRVVLVPVNLNLDTVHGFTTEEKKVNSRSEALVKRCIDPIHPNASGKNQMADVFSYVIKNNI